MRSEFTRGRGREGCGLHVMQPLAVSRNPRMAGRSQCSSVMTACPIKSGAPIRKHSSHKSEGCPSVRLPVSSARLKQYHPKTIHPHWHTHTSFAVGGVGCPCPFSPRSGGGCNVMMSSSSGGFQMYCSPLPMNTASW